MPSRSTVVAALLVALLLAGGCLGNPERPTTGSVSTTATPSETPAGTEYASQRPDPSQSVTLENWWNQTVSIHLTVVRVATGETVVNETFAVAPGEEVAAYNTVEADPQGVERFAVTATALNATESVSIETSRCYGGAYVSITEDGELFATYAIC
ncbi:hypothetical protein [Halobaculum lipolyticum]|uniref:Uncharacterized protein n=1 Tax=Halobaculum lipolyticum TaxID=3032001 RepID=A0ABD5WH00_9EURY|nr:hypothetical protein [Halobaculum sp. DT31]